MFNGFTVILSNFCNLRCPYCLQDAAVKQGREISAKELIAFFNSGKVDIKFLKLTGGEPLSNEVYPKTKAILDYAFSRGIKIQLNTNGTYPLQDDLNKDLLTFQVSVDGLYDRHDKVRGKGVFDKTIAFIREQVPKGYGVNVMRVIQEDSEPGEVEEYIDFFVKNFGIYPKFMQMTPNGRAELYRKTDITSKADLAELINSKGCNCRPIKYRCSTPEGKANRAGIDQYGNIIPCPMMKKFTFGTIYNFNETKIREEMSRRLKGCTCCYPEGYKEKYSFAFI